MFTKSEIEKLLKSIRNQTTFKDAKEIIDEFADEHDLDFFEDDDEDEVIDEDSNDEFEDTASLFEDDEEDF